MWSDVLTWSLVAALLLVLGLLIQHGWRLNELAQDEEDEARRRENDTAVFGEPPKIPELESGTVTDTDMAPIVQTGWGWGFGKTRWARIPGGLRGDRRRLADDATRVLEPLVGVLEAKPISAPPVPEPWNGDTHLVPQVQRRLPRPVTSTDELGEWVPAAHTPVEPRILGDVLAWRKWKTVRPEHVGMTAQ